MKFPLNKGETAHFAFCILHAASKSSKMSPRFPAPSSGGMKVLWLALALTSRYATVAVASATEMEVGTDGMPIINNAAASGAADTNAVTDTHDDLPTGGSSSCVDTDDRCSSWSDVGECDANAAFMRKACPQSCGLCNDDNNGEMPLGADYGVPQLAEGQRAEETRALIAKADEYMKSRVFIEEEFRSVRSDCKNRDPLCSFWAVEGECEANPSYMIIQCAPACQSCEKVNIENRCPLDRKDGEDDIFKPGDLNKMFERVSNAEDAEIARYSPSVLSQPPDGPWVVVFDSFLTPEECKVLLEMGDREGYERSTDVGKRQFDGSYDKHESDSRTSQNAWCRDDCYENPVARGVMDKIANLTGIPERNSEHLQLLKYDVGQYYKSHHDYIPFHTKRQCGVRVLTLFLYLNDVQKGGGTHFDELDITVEPKAGKAVLWPSVLDERPNEMDARTYHQALPVEEGFKFGANAWLHQRDFKAALDMGCV